MATNVRTVEVRLEVTGEGQFKSQMGQAAGAVKQVGTEAMTAQGHASGTVTVLGRMGEVAKTAIGSFIGFGSAQAAMMATAEASKIVREEILGVNDAVAQAAAVFGNVSGKQRDDMVKMAHDLGVEWGMSSAVIAQGFRSLADEGFTAEQAIGALPQLVAFARAGMIDLGTATHDVVGVMYSFGLVSNDAAKNTANLVHVTDMLTAGANASHATIGSLSEGLAKVGPIATSLGIPVHEVIALMSELSDVGFSGRRAMLAFTTLFTELPKHAADLHKAGVEIYDSAGQLRPVGQIIAGLQEKFRGLSAQQIQTQLTSLGFSSATSKVVLALIGAGDGFAQLDRAIQHSSGVTQSVASKAMESLSLRIAQVREAAIRLAIDGVEKMAEFAAWLGQEFTPAFEKLGSVAAATAHFLEPIAVILAGTGFVAGKVAIEGIAVALDHTAGFLEHNQKLVEVLVILYGIKLVAAVSSAGLAMVQAAGFNIEQWAFSGAQALATLITSFQQARTAAQDAGQGFATLRAGWSTFGSAAIAGGAIAVLTFEVLGLVSALQQGKAAGQAMVASLTVHAGGGKSQLEADAESLKALNGEYDKLLKSSGFGHFDITRGLKAVGELPGAALGLQEDKPIKQRAELDQLDQAIQDLQQRDTKIKSVMLDIYSSLHTVPKAAGGTQPWFAQNAGDADAVISRLSAIASRVGLDLTKPVEQWQGALTDAVRAADGLPPAGQEAALAIQAVGQAAQVGTSQADAFAKALTAISDAAFGMDDKLRSSKSAILDLIDARNAADKKGVHFGDDMTREGIAFTDAAEKVITSYQGILVEMVKHGARAKEVADATKFLDASFRGQASALGIPQAAIDHLLSGLHLSATQLRALKLNVNVDSAQLDAAKKKADEAQAHAKALESQKHIHVDASQLDAAKKKAGDTKAALEFLQAHPSILKVDTKPLLDANQALRDAKAHLDALLSGGGHPDPMKLAEAKRAVQAAKDKLDEALKSAEKLAAAKIKPKTEIDMSGFNTGAQRINAQIRAWNTTPITFSTTQGLPPPLFTPQPIKPLHGGIVRFADGGQLVETGRQPRTVQAAAGGFMQSNSPLAQIAPAGAWRVWAEPETGGEAYIPLAPAKRARSTTILSTVASMFGLNVAPRRFADGGVTGSDPHHGTRHTEDAGHTADPVRRVYSARQLSQYAELELARLHVSFGPLGLHTPRLQWVTDRQMRDEYKGVTIYGPSPDAIANGDANTGRIQLNRDLLTHAVDPLAYTRVAVTKEWAQTVLPHFLDNDRKIKRYFDIIGYRPKTDAHLVDDLWSGQATVAGNTTTPADLFGYFAAHLIGGHTASPGGFDFAAYGAIAERLRKAGLIPGQIKSDPVISFLARLIHANGGSQLERAIRQLSKLPDQPPPASSTSTAGTTVVATRPDGSTITQDDFNKGWSGFGFADGGLAQYDVGGEVPGPPGAPQLAVVHGGERVLTEHENRAYAAGGINYVGSDINQEATRQANITHVSQSMAGAPIFRNTAGAAAAGITDPVQRQQAIQAALLATAQMYIDVATAAGKSAADQLAASGLVGQALTDAAQKIIADAQARKQAAIQAAAEVKATRRQIQDDEFADGKISFANYVHLLRERLAATKKYSADWLAIHEQIRGAQATEDQKAQAKQQAKQSAFDKYAGPQEQAVSLTGAFGTAKTVTSDEIRGFLKNVEEGVKQFRDVIRELVAKGYATSIVQQIAEQGPTALPLAKALLQVPVAEVNGDMAEINAIIASTSSSDARTFGTGELAQIHAPKQSGPKLESESGAEHAAAAAHKAYRHAVDKYRNDRAHHVSADRLKADRAAVRSARARVTAADADLGRATGWASAVPDAEPDTPPPVAPPGPGLPGYVSTISVASTSSSGPSPAAGSQLATTMPSVRGNVDQSVRVTFADGSIKLDLRGAATRAASMADIGKLVKAGVSTELDRTFARMDRDIRSGSQSPTGR